MPISSGAAHCLGYITDGPSGHPPSIQWALFYAATFDVFWTFSNQVLSWCSCCNCLSVGLQPRNGIRHGYAEPQACLPPCLHGLTVYFGRSQSILDRFLFFFGCSHTHCQLPALNCFPDGLLLATKADSNRRSGADRQTHTFLDPSNHTPYLSHLEWQSLIAADGEQHTQTSLYTLLTDTNISLDQFK